MGRIDSSMEEIQKDLDDCIHYNIHRTHQGKMRCGSMPLETLADEKSFWTEKNLAQT